MQGGCLLSLVPHTSCLPWTRFNVKLFVLQTTKNGRGATSEGEANGSAEETEPLLQDDVDWHTNTRQHKETVLWILHDY